VRGIIVAVVAASAAADAIGVTAQIGGALRISVARQNDGGLKAAATKASFNR
jgi:hypothetical protein